MARHSGPDNPAAAKAPAPSKRPARGACTNAFAPKSPARCAVCRHRHQTGARARHLPRPLIIGEPENSVLPERSAYRIAKLVLPQLGLSRIEKVARIKMIVAQELEGGSMHAVRTRFRDRIHHAAAEPPVLGVEAICDQPEFSNRIEVGNKTCAQVSSFADVTAIHQKCIRSFALAIHRNVAGRKISRYRPILLHRPRKSPGSRPPAAPADRCSCARSTAAIKAS